MRTPTMTLPEVTVTITADRSTPARAAIAPCTWVRTLGVNEETSPSSSRLNPTRLIAGGEGGGDGGVGGVGVGVGDGEGGGGKGGGGLEYKRRGPQSMQSSPTAHEANSAPGPPSEHEPARADARIRASHEHARG